MHASIRRRWVAGASLAGFVSVAVPAHAQTDGALSPAAAARIDSVAQAEMAQTRTPGASLVIVHGDRVIYAKGYGVASVETRQPVSPDALFRLGSTTKMMTSLAALSLSARGVVDLDTPISRYAPAITSPRLRGVTLRQLLTHSAGLLDYTSMSGPHDDAALNAFVPTLTDTAFFTQPGDMFSYSNLGYSVAGYVLSEAAHKPYADVMHDEVFLPLGMTHSTLRPIEAMTFLMVQGHERTDSGTVRVARPAPDDSRYWPAGSVFTSALDFSRLAIAMMNGGQLEGRQALPAGVIRTWLTPMAPIRGEANAPPRAYAFGLEIRRQHGDTVVDHTGSRGGFGSMFRMIPSRKVAVIVLANSTASYLRQTLEAAVVAVAPEFASEPVSRAAPVALSPKDGASLVGRYLSAPGRGLEIFIDGDRVMSRRIGGDVAGNATQVQLVGPNAYLAGSTRFVTATGADGATRYLLTGLRAMRRTP